MIGQFFKFLTNKMSCALINGAQGVSLFKFLLTSASVEIDGGMTVSSFLETIINIAKDAIHGWVYIIAKYVLMFIDFCQVIIYKIAGIDNDLEKMVDLPIFKFLLNETVLKIIGTIMVLSLIILILVTIVAIVKSEYEASLDDKKDPKVVAYKVVGKSFVSLFLMVVTPFLVIIAIIFSSVLLSSVNNVLNPNDTEQATLGGTLFKTSAYNANKYRLYASDGKRIPVILNFDDPYQDGTYGFYTSEQLHEIYESWNGEEIYNMFASGAYPEFNDTLVYKNGKIYNANSYSDYERFVATSEQYYVMADFIDYAISHEITYYIKDSNDKEIDWSRMSSNIKISDGVYDPVNKTITITYEDVSNLSPYENYYTITFETSSASANSPITDAVSTISLILGLNTIVSGATARDISVNNTSTVGPVNLTNTSLTNSASAVEDLLQEVNDTSETSGVLFRLLERVEGSTNVVRWQTEKALYNGKEYTVYTLNKVFKNQYTGINETKATVKVAKKDDSLSSRYYVVSEEVNEFGYYEYTNVQIDYYNDGKDYLDTLTPIYKLATWPKKLYNDLSIIYSDIDFDNYLSYDNWSDALGVYYKTDNNATSAEVATFATTLIHPLGLIMSELFLGTTLEGGNGNTASFSFASSYLEDVINSLTLSVGGQFDYKNMSYQIDNFITLFNAQFASVIESLQKIEGFDLYGNDAMSVQGYVYKAYLASIMLSSEYSDYLKDIAETVLSSQRLIEIICMGSNSLIYDENGDVVYKLNYITDEAGNHQPLYYNDNPDLAKVVYNKNGKKVYTAGGYGQLSPTGYFIPKTHVQYKIEVWEDDLSDKTITAYKVYSEKVGEYIWSTTLLSDKDYNTRKAELDKQLENEEITLETYTESLPEKFTDYFETYFTIENDAIYVYEPADGDTTKDSTIVTKKLFSADSSVVEKIKNNIDNQAMWDFLESGISDILNIKVNLGDTALDEYYIYEIEKVIDSTSRYLTYGELPEYYQKFISNIISTIEHDVEVGRFDEPEYLKFLIAYQQNDPSMAEVMSADLISSAIAKSHLKEYDSILSKIEFYTNAMNQATSFSQQQSYYQQLWYNQNKLNKLTKYYIIYGIESYASTQVSSNFTVIVNNHPYNVSQGMVQRQLIEVIYGNKLTYDSLIGKLSNQTPYEKLGEFDQDAFEQLCAYVNYYNNQIRLYTSGNVKNAKIFSGKLTEFELQLISDYYQVKTGIYKNFTNAYLKNLRSDLKQDLLNLLNTTSYDMDKMISNYINGKTITAGTTYNLSIDEAYSLLTGLTRLAVGDEQLYFVESDYEGLIDDNNQGFSLLRSFLKDFGDLCFNLARKSNLDTIGEFETENLLDYVDDLIDVLLVKLSDLDLGASFGTISKIESISDLATILGDDISDSTKFSDLTNTSKEYIYTLYSVYNQKVADYEALMEEYKNAKDYSARYNMGRYAMQSDSFVYATGLQNYLNYFRYHTDINDEAFKEKYVYEGYIGSVEEFDDRLYYYNLYLEAFDGIVLGTSGIYFENLTELQQKVMLDMADYYYRLYDEFRLGTNEEYSQNLYNRDLLKGVIFDDNTIGGKNDAVEINSSSSQVSVVDLFNENVNLLNLYNLLDFVGLDYDVNKTLGDYRLDALNSLITFNERAGESGASIQARYLTLLYLVCSDYTTNAFGETTIAIDAGTKATILKLAGLEGVAEENLVGLEYEVDNTDAISDEKFGSVYIICTYNSESEMYEPFVFASSPDTYGTPSTNYYASDDGEIKYFPVIAKGVIGPDGLPTAIREVNGYIEFYRDNVCIVDAGELGLDMYYMSVEDISINYNPINYAINGLTKLFTGKSLARHILDSVPVIISSKNLNFAYGTTTDYVYHLQSGEFTLNYMFYTDTGIQLNCLYLASEFNIIILMFGTLLLAGSLISAMFGVIRNLYELLLVVMIYPGVLALYPLKDGPTSTWRKELIDKLLLCFGYVIAINGFFLILNLLQTMDIKLILTEESRAELQNTWLFGKFDFESVLNTLFTYMLFMVAVTLIKTLPDMFSKMLGAGDVTKRGDNARKMAKINLEEAKYFATGYAIEDMVLSKVDALKGRPLAGASDKELKAYKERLNKKDHAQIVANKRAVRALETKLKNQGISDPVVEKAVKAYEESLNRQLEAQRQRQEADYEARRQRMTKHQKRQKGIADIVKSEAKNSKSPKVCKHCGFYNGPKEKKCKRCHEKL